ncbi:uncharacterized protein LOC123525082 [Mercenaria mercenaria]|uniref:uncharacterized protein LOC123525082 n=1 Tax=Mercenaria mercenaria TaxID=6596 RepID=UPI00234EC5E7|nr:uncharacterized protein LOC123525082 [Mercenaria mercenaria]
MDWRKCLLGINVLVLCGIIPVLSYDYGPEDVKLDLVFSQYGYSVPDDMFSTINVYEREGRSNLAHTIGSITEQNNIKIHALLPEIDDDEACYFAVGFLSPLDSTTGYRAFPNRTECMNSQMEENYYYYEKNTSMERKRMPTIGVADEILRYPKCINSSEDLEEVNWLNIIRENNRPHCGMYRLVIMLDPMHRAENDPDFCNNFVTIDVNFDCSDRDFPEPTCELVSPDSDDKEEALMFIKDEMHDQMYNYRKRFRHRVRMFTKDGNMHTNWREEKPDSETMVEENHKFRAMKKMLSRYVEGQIEERGVAKICPGDVKSQLDELQGLPTKVNQWEERMHEPGKGMYRTFLSILSDSVKSMHEFENSLDESIVRKALEKVHSNEHNGTISTGLAARVINELVNQLRANNKEYAKKHVAMYACEVSHNLESLMHEYSVDNEYSYYGGERRYQYVSGEMAYTTATLAVGLMYFYPDFYDRCYRNILIRLNNLTKEVYNGRSDLRWMMDESFLEALNNRKNNLTEYQYYEIMRNCGKPNPCLKKLRSMCDQTDSQMAYEKPVETLREDICKKKKMKEIMSRHAQRVSKEDMMPNNPFDAVCHGGDKMSMGRSSMMKIENGVIMNVSLNLDNTKVIINPVARCRCQKCDSRTYDTDDYDSSDSYEKYEYGDSGSMPEHSGDNYKDRTRPHTTPRYGDMPTKNPEKEPPSKQPYYKKK